METLNVQTVQLELSADTLTAVRNELADGGLITGTVLIGGLATNPELLYIMWHEMEQIPVSMTFRHPMNDVAKVRCAAREFLQKWRYYIG
jgi:hypothetical protein